MSVDRMPIRQYALLCVLLASAQVHAWERDILRKDFGYSERSAASIALGDIQQGCERRDCIVSIDAPKFVAAGAVRFLADDDLVLAIRIGQTARAYPVRILNYHEIVNDTIDGEPIAISFCPLCGSGTAFSRRVGGRTTTFGVSGLLYNSDLIMYDRASKSLWQQITGTAIVGPRRGDTLTSVPVTMTTWAEWRDAHPKTMALAPPDADGRYAVATPYGDYGASSRLMFPVGANDPRVHPKTVVFGIEIDGQPIAVSERLLTRDGSVTHNVRGRAYIWSKLADGTIELRDDQGGVSRSAHRMFWFAWFSFHPGTQLRDTLHTR